MLGSQVDTIADAMRHIESGNAVAAEQIARSILKVNARDVYATRVIGLAASLRRETDKAVTILKRCCAMEPNEPVFHRDLGKILMDAGRFDESAAAYDRALKAMPDDVSSIVGKADVLERAGRAIESRALLAPFQRRGLLTPSMTVVLARLEIREGRHHEALALVEPCIAGATRSPRERALLFQLAARCHESLGDFGSAFEAFAKAKELDAAPFDRAQFARAIDELMAIFNRTNLARLPVARDQSPLPMFIASMPRSGSTLVEQIIHAHPEAHGAGEIPQFNDIAANLQTTIASFQVYPACIADLTQQHVDEIAASYLKALRSMAAGKKRIVNKHLENYRHLGLVSLVCPGARVIHVKRDPLDNGFGIFMASLDPGKIRYASDLADIGFAYRQYERLMDHWRRELDIEMLDVQYEDLVADSDTWIRRIIDFTGLKWNDKCLRYYDAKRDVITLSYDQVRKPIYNSAVARWKKYEAFLEPLKQALARETED